MRNIDEFLSKSLVSMIKKDLGKKALDKIEKRLFEKYGITVTESMRQFNKLDVILREFFGAGTDGLEEKWLKKICELEIVEIRNKPSKNIIKVNDQSLVRIIRETYCDKSKEEILCTLLDVAMTPNQILEKFNISQTTGYRKINQLIKNGLLIESGYVMIPDKKRVKKYIAVLNDVNIRIVNGKIGIEIGLDDESFEGSSILHTIYSKMI